MDEGGFLTARQVALYGRFGGPPSEEELERFFVLDDADRKLIAKRRDDSSRLGFALQWLIRALLTAATPGVTTGPQPTLRLVPSVPPPP
ncbi:DUF4158 domain-containing protein [Nocardia exalbida]|uniref:DUF4158 domain-containing protein n=1 Tax=Nocardia exalbida TaxID=290231 RepID=UPI0005938EE9